MPAKIRKVYIPETEEEISKMDYDEVTVELNDKERAFCELYLHNNNVKIAAVKAGYKAESANIQGWKLRQKPKVQLYLTWLKLRMVKKHMVTAMDVLDQYIRIAFADITDFVEVKGRSMVLVEGTKIDGQLVKTLRHGKDGITIELYNKLDALEKLERYFDVMPADWKQKVEERKLVLLEQKLELERKKLGLNDEGKEDDGFIEALKGSAEEVWLDGNE